MPTSCHACKQPLADSALFCPNCGTPKARDPDADQLIGTVLGERFLIQDKLGDGTSGRIYRAEHVTLRRRVAIKVLHHELSRDDLAVERFRREATSVAELDNEHIVEIHDFGRAPDGRLYLAMELLEGETLDALLAREGKLSIERATDIAIQVGEALMEAHAIGYVHRDIRPRNIYLSMRRGKANFVKLLDFGLAKIVESDSQAASTSLGMTFGDPRYMSPEAARGDRIDRRADIYQLGCVVYEMLTGTPPFVGAKVFDILSKHVSEAPAPLPSKRPSTPVWLEAAVTRMLAKRVDDRFMTISRMVEALRIGLATGAIMDEAIARRTETTPPPSVSRAMERFGNLGGDAALGDNSAAPRGLAPIADGSTAVRTRTGTPRAGVPIVSTATVSGRAVAPPPIPPSSPSIAIPRTMTPPPIPRAQLPAVPVPVRAPVPPLAIVKTADDAVPTATDSLRDSAGFSQLWFEDGEAQAAGESQRGKIERSKHSNRRNERAMSSAGTGNIYVEDYDESRAPRRRRAMWIGGVVGVGLVATAFAWKVSNHTSSSLADKPAAPVAVAVPPPLDAGASPDALLDAAPTVAVAAVPTKAQPPVAPSHQPVGPAAAETTDSFLSTLSNRQPAPLVPPPVAVAPVAPPQPEVVVPPAHAVAIAPDPSGSSGPVDPYGGDSAPAPTVPHASPAGVDSHPLPTTDGTNSSIDAARLAVAGADAFHHGDAGTAAADYNKALGIDAKNVDATIGLGEIALQQGSAGAALVHFKKAARLAPKSARVQTLLGEAYLSSGNNPAAAASFKKALQIEPDNSRARDGYNEASSRVPAAKDE